MIKPTMSMAVSEVHLSELLFEYYKKKSEMLDDLFINYSGSIAYPDDLTMVSFVIPTTEYDSLIEVLYEQQNNV